MSAPASPDYDRLLVEPPFRFDMAIRRSAGAFFRNDPRATETLLPERQELLRKHPDRHAALRPRGRELLAEAAGLATDLNGSSLTLTPGPGGWDTAACRILGGIWEPDFLLLRPEGDDFILEGGVLCFPSSWSLEEKLGHPLRWIHEPVPTLNARLGGRVGTFLQSLKPGIEWERVNWGIAGTPLLNLHPSIEHPRLEEGATLSSAWLRVEHQALRLLPESGGILFGIRITLHRLDNLARNRTAALRLAELLETMPQAIADYKGLAQARNPLVRQLRKPGGTEAP